MSSDTTRIALAEVAAQLNADGGLLANTLLPANQIEPAADDPALGALAAGGPLSAGREQQIAAIVEAVYEGYLLHGCQSRILSVADSDLNILTGDRLYALGLAQLAQLGDLDSVRELSDVIAISSQARVINNEPLAAAAWQLAASAIGWGSSPASEAAKAEVARDHQVAAAALRAAARQLREGVA